jgi:hypothetical protein
MVETFGEGGAMHGGIHTSHGLTNGGRIGDVAKAQIASRGGQG